MMYLQSLVPMIGILSTLQAQLHCRSILAEETQQEDVE
jgi:hypothetical protein